MAMAVAMAIAMAIAMHGHSHSHGHGHSHKVMAMEIAMAMAMMVMAMAVIRPEHAEGRRNDENLRFNEKRVFRPILVISGPSRRQKWIRLEISCRMVLLRVLESTI